MVVMLSINHMHPIEDIRGSKSSRLEGKTIVLGITGSIAAVETIKMARELARHGADVIPVMSDAAAKIIHPDAIHFATGHEPIIRLDGAVKHVELCGETSSRADLLLIAPATANTISKVAHGIDDTPVTTMATCAMGSQMPIIIVPAMHGSMYKHKILLDNIEILKKHGVVFVQPRVEEGKAKIADQGQIVAEVIRHAGRADLKKNKFLIITGSTKEGIDDVRYIGNKSSGRTGIEIAVAAYHRGAEVEVWAPGDLSVPGYLSTKTFTDVKSLEKMASNPKNLKFDYIIVPAAISDFTVKAGKKGKISSSKPPEIKLTSTSKILPLLKKNSKSKIIGFKAETGISVKELESRANKRMKEHDLDMMIANLLEKVGPDKTEALLIYKDKTTKFKGEKSKLADEILDIILGL